MATLSLKVIDRNDNTVCVSSGENFADLVCMHEYREGDRITLETSEKNIYVNWQVDDAFCSFGSGLQPHRWKYFVEGVASTGLKG